MVTVASQKDGPVQMSVPPLWDASYRSLSEWREGVVYWQLARTIDVRLAALAVALW